MPRKLVIRSRLGYWSSLICAAVCVYLIVDQFFQRGLLSTLRLAFFPALIIAFTMTTWFSPRLIVLKGGIWLYNPVYVYRISWEDIDEIYNSWGVRIRTKHHDIPVWVLPTNRTFVTPHEVKDNRPTYWNTLIRLPKDKHELAHQDVVKETGTTTMDSVSGGRLLRKRMHEYMDLPQVTRRQLREEFEYMKTFHWFNTVIWAVTLGLILVRIAL